MQLRYRGKTRLETLPGSAITGHHCDEVRLSLMDFEIMSKMPAEKLKDYLITNLMTRFAPPTQ